MLVLLLHGRGEIMKGEIFMNVEEEDEMLPEYDFSKGVRGKYAQRYV